MVRGAARRGASTVAAMTEYTEMNTAELRRNLAATLDRVAAGERVVILRHDQPAAVLVPADTADGPAPGCDCPKWKVPGPLRAITSRVGLTD